MPGRERIWEMEVLWLRELAESGLCLQRQNISMPNRKPQSVNVCQDGFLYETDLATAVELTGVTACNVTPRSRHGTCGYSDPLYLATGRCERKTDVWNFGVIMGEMITGLSATFSDENGVDICLSDILRDYSSIRLATTIAECGGYPQDVALQIVHVIKSCLSTCPSDRPDFAEILALLRVICPVSSLTSNPDSASWASQEGPARDSVATPSELLGGEGRSSTGASAITRTSRSDGEGPHNSTATQTPKAVPNVDGDVTRMKPRRRGVRGRRKKNKSSKLSTA